MRHYTDKLHYLSVLAWYYSFTAQCSKQSTHYLLPIKQALTVDTYMNICSSAFTTQISGLNTFLKVVMANSTVHCHVIAMCTFMIFVMAVGQLYYA